MSGGFFGIVGGEGVCGWEDFAGSSAVQGGVGLDGLLEFRSKLFQDFGSWLLWGHTVSLWDGSSCLSCPRSPPVCAFLPSIDYKVLKHIISFIFSQALGKKILVKTTFRNS